MFSFLVSTGPLLLFYLIGCHFWTTKNKCNSFNFSFQSFKISQFICKGKNILVLFISAIFAWGFLKVPFWIYCVLLSLTTPSCAWAVGVNWPCCVFQNNNLKLGTRPRTHPKTRSPNQLILSPVYTNSHPLKHLQDPSITQERKRFAFLRRHSISELISINYDTSCCPRWSAPAAFNKKWQTGGLWQWLFGLVGRRRRVILVAFCIFFFRPLDHMTCLLIMITRS